MVLQSISDQVRISYISQKEERLFSSARQIIMHSRHSDSLSAIIMSNTRFSDLFQWVINYAEKSKQECNSQVPQSRPVNTVLTLQSSQFIQEASHSTYFHYTRVRKPSQ